MKGKENTLETELRVTVKLLGDDYPDLSRELKQARKGPARTRRLIALAYLGLISERNGMQVIRPFSESPSSQQLPQSAPQPIPSNTYEAILGDTEILDLVTGAGTNMLVGTT